MKRSLVAAALLFALAINPAHARARRPVAPDVVEHPAGCPHVAFCGCGAAMFLWGKVKDGLMSAREWLKFPRARPAPRHVAVRTHHVFVLLEPRGGDQWLVYDANSGGHLTRIHVRSIAGYTIVDPERRA